jgi:hypothetical protein
VWYAIDSSSILGRSSRKENSLTWIVEEKKSDIGTETLLTVKEDGVVKGSADVTLYANGPCIKCLASLTESGPRVTQLVVDYLQEHYGYPYGVFAYVYDYAEYERPWFEKAGLKFFRDLDGGSRLMLKLDPPMVN